MLIKLIAGMALGLGLGAQAFATTDHNRCPAANADHKPIFRSIPVMPHTASLLCLEGEVLVEFTVNEYGQAVNPIIHESDHPGIFEQAIFDELENWVYQPGCVDGQPTPAQQRTIFEFALEADYLVDCQRRAELLHGESLNLVSDLVAHHLRAMDWLTSTDQTESLESFLAGLQPTYSGDLGRIEQFVLAHIEAWMRTISNRNHSAGQTLDAIHAEALASTNQTPPLHGESLNKLHQQLRENYLIVLERPRDGSPDYNQLLESVSISDDKVHAMVSQFVERPDIDSSPIDALVIQAVALIDEMFELLGRPDADWEVDEEGFVFDSAEDLRQFSRLQQDYIAVHDTIASMADHAARSLDAYRL